MSEVKETTWKIKGKYLYRQDPSGDWTFITELEDEILCAINSHEALLAAAKGLVRAVSMNQYWKELPGAIKVNIAKAIEAIALAKAQP